MGSLFAERILGIPWIAVVAVALVVAAIYLVWDLSGEAVGWRWVVLRWFHSLCWLFLALAAFAKTRITGLPVEWAAPLAVVGGLTYAVYLVVNFTG